MMKSWVLLASISLLLAAPSWGQPSSATPKTGTALPAERQQRALAAMKAKAEALGIQGVAVVALIPDDDISSWSSGMLVVGKMLEEPSGNPDARGANLLGIAYGKASEMAATLKNSGEAGRPPMTGEYGWKGGLIRKGPAGYLVAAFSGGPSADDLKVSRAGLDALETMKPATP